MNNLNSNEVKNEPIEEMTEKELQAEFGDKNESDSWGLEFRPDIGKKIDEQKRIASIEAQEGRVIAEVKKHNAELRQWWKWVGVSVVVLLLISALTVKFTINYNWLVDSLLAIAFVVFVIAESKYLSLKKRGIARCENCGEEFVPKENDLDKKCLHCNQGHTATYL